MRRISTQASLSAFPESKDLRGGHSTEHAELHLGTGPGCRLAQPASAAEQLTPLAAQTSSPIPHSDQPNLSADKICFNPTLCPVLQETVSQYSHYIM